MRKAKWVNLKLRALGNVEQEVLAGEWHEQSNMLNLLDKLLFSYSSRIFFVSLLKHQNWPERTACSVGKCIKLVVLLVVFL